MRGKRVLIYGSGIILAIALIVYLLYRHHSETSASGQTTAVRDVSVMAARIGAISQDLTVAGVFQPYQEIDVHGKVSGYIRNIYVDIGDRVRQGQTLAILEVPELDAQVAGAEASVKQSQQDIARLKSDVERAQANYVATHANYTRLKQASDEQPGLVAQQELDDALAQDRAAAAQVDASKAAVAAAEGQLGVSRADRMRVSSLVQYATITAPFTGVVTMRYADTGALIPAGTSESDAQAVVRLAQSDLLRLRMPVPEEDVPLVQEGSVVMVHVQATGQQFPGKVIRFTRDVSNATRTMLCEVDVPNPDLSLTPGMFADVTFHLRQKQDTLIVPTAAIIQGDQPAVFIVDSSGTVQRRLVVLGITSANEQEITEGLQVGENVVVGGMDTLQPGQRVHAQMASPELVTYHAASAKGDQ
jgi:RND family efflux transporter MFP subunit